MKIWIILTVSLFLIGCKATQQATGVWYGTAVDPQGNAAESVLLINEKGNVYITLRNGFFLFVNEEVAFVETDDGTDFYTTALSNSGSPDFVSLNKDEIIDVMGNLGDNDGSVEITSQGEVLYTLTLIRDPSPIAQQSDFEGTWRINPEDPNSIDTWTISSDGILKGEDPMGCSYTGHITALDSVNLADFVVIVDSCQYTGLYTGVMSLFADPLDPTGERKGIFYNFGNSDYVFVNGLEIEL